MAKILEGLRVLDFTLYIAGPYCTRLLADCGCEVINIEEPGGQRTRKPPYYLYKGQSPHYMYECCGKKSIEINLKTAAGRELALDLAKVSDIIVENYQARVMKSLGLDYPVMKGVNPGVIMCSISGFGQDGPYAQLMGADTSVQAYSGVLDLTGEPGRRPSFVGFYAGDVVAGLNAFGAICAALYRRTQTGQGENIDISLLDCMVAALNPTAVGMHILSQGEEEIHRSGAFNPTMGPQGVYKGRDGYCVINAFRDEGWATLTGLMGKPEVASDPRFDSGENRSRNNREVTAIIESWLRKFERVSDAVALLQSHRILAAPVQTVAQVVDGDPQIKARNMFVELDHPVLGKTKFINTPLRFTNVEAGIGGIPPVVSGEHTDHVLRDVLHLDGRAVKKLRDDGIVAGPRSEP